LTARKTLAARKPREQPASRTMFIGEVSPLARLVIITSVPRVKMSSMKAAVRVVWPVVVREFF